jgi:hypothetical protein
MNGPGYTLDENEITFNYGPNYSNEEPIAFLSDNAILMYGCSCWEANLDVEIVLFLSCGLYPNTPGEHIGTYGDEVTDIGTCSIGFHITEEQKYFYTSNDIIVTITSFGDVGEDVEGNFSCTLEYVNAAATSFGSPLTVIGEFRVLRAAEDVYPPPPV